MMALSTSDLNRLAHVLALLGSSHQGERDAAALAADRLVRGRGLEWADLLAPKPAAYVPPPVYDVEAELRLCRTYANRLNEWERGFLRGLRPGCPLSVKQRGILSALARKVRAE